MVKGLDFLVKPVKGSDVIMDRLLWLIFQRNKLLECVALTQHGDVSKIGFESRPYIAGRIAVPDQLEFGLDDGGNEDAHSVAVRYFPLRNCFGSIVVVRRVGFAGDDVVQETTEFNLAFEAPLLVGSSCESIDRTYDRI